jgi:hypothetical protein
MGSEWVKTEIAKARKREVRDGARVLFPISLVPFKVIRDWECFDADTGKDSAREIRAYFIPDFSNWKDHDAYATAFDRLLRDQTRRCLPTEAKYKPEETATVWSVFWLQPTSDPHKETLLTSNTVFLAGPLLNHRLGNGVIKVVLLRPPRRLHKHDGDHLLFAIDPPIRPECPIPSVASIGFAHASLGIIQYYFAS